MTEYAVYTKSNEAQHRADMADLCVWSSCYLIIGLGIGLVYAGLHIMEALA